MKADTKTPVQTLREKYNQDMTQSIQRRDAMVKEANTLNLRISQLEGALFALKELENPTPEAETPPNVQKIVDAQVKRERKATKNVTPENSAGPDKDSATKSE